MSIQLRKCVLDNPTHDEELSIVEYGSIVILDVRIIYMWIIRV